MRKRRASVVRVTRIQWCTTVVHKAHQSSKCAQALPRRPWRRRLALKTPKRMDSTAAAKVYRIGSARYGLRIIVSNVIHRKKEAETYRDLSEKAGSGWPLHGFVNAGAPSSRAPSSFSGSGSQLYVGISTVLAHGAVDCRLRGVSGVRGVRCPAA
jgi:hypothetical protein